MQTRSGKIYTIRGKYHVATGPLLDSEISKVLLEIQRIRSGIDKVPKITKLYRIINDNFDDKMAIWNGGKLHHYASLNRTIYEKTFEFEEKIQGFLEKIVRENKNVNKTRGAKDAIKQLHVFRSKYTKHKADMLAQIQDWIGTGTSHCENSVTLSGIKLSGVVSHVVSPVVKLGVVSLKDRIDDNIASTILSYLYRF
jgi:hypothetical protein